MMYWQWQSRQGDNRLSNNDAVTVVNKGDVFFALLLDVAEKSNNSHQFSQYWPQTITQCALTLGESLTVERLLNDMRKQQKLMRAGYLHEIASYSLLIYNKRTRECNVLVVGDCRVGLESNANIQWLTHPHTLKAAFNGSLVETSNNKVSRHTLTRTLNAKRFVEPDHYFFSLTSPAQLLLCTDGYWAEYLNEKNKWEDLSDDASCLRCSPFLPLAPHIDSDCVNYFSYE